MKKIVLNSLISMAILVSIIACGEDEEVKPLSLVNTDSINIIKNDLLGTWNIYYHEQRNNMLDSSVFVVSYKKDNMGSVKFSSDTVSWDRNKDGIFETNSAVKYEIEKGRFISNYQYDPNGEQRDQIDTVYFSKSEGEFLLIDRSAQYYDSAQYTQELVYKIKK